MTSQTSTVQSGDLFSVQQRQLFTKTELVVLAGQYSILCRD